MFINENHPTGSLCAERNVIGTALAANPGLRREDLMMVAVLSVPILSDPSKSSNSVSNSLPSSRVPSPPPGPSNICSVLDGRDSSNTPAYASTFYSETSAFVTEVEEKLSEYQRPENIRRSMSIGSFASIIECNGSDESDSSWDKMPTVATSTTTAATNVGVNVGNVIHTPPTTGSKPVLQLQDKFSESSKHNYLAPSSGSSTPIRKIRLHSENSEISAMKNPTLGKSLGRKKKIISVHSSEVSKIRC